MDRAQAGVRLEIAAGPAVSSRGNRHVFRQFLEAAAAGMKRADASGFHYVERNGPSSAAARAGMTAAIRGMKAKTPDHNRTDGRSPDDRNADYRIVAAATQSGVSSRARSEPVDRRRNCRPAGIAMSEQQAFGPRLRRAREGRGISLE